ncbi:MAG TPA: hypothetical protein VI756_22745 [Blastocatellia bacterium]
MIASRGREVLADPIAVDLPAGDLNDYVGSYKVGTSLTPIISRDGEALVISTNGEKPARLAAETRDVFFRPGSTRTSLIFQRDGSGRITGCLTRREGRDLVFTKT